jgi:ubiquinone biosynthesis protein
VRLFASHFRRLAWIARVLAAHALAHALGPRLDRLPWLARHLPTGTLTRPQRLAATLEDLGGTFIKLGQMLALQPDILSLEYCDALFDLMDQVAPFAWEEASRVFQEETGRSPDEAFDRFDRRPIATASIGQVYVAWKDGSKLSVKVQRPAVETDFKGDIRLMVAFIGLIRRLRLPRFYWMIEPLSEFVGWTSEELDYRNEARYMARLRENARDNRWEQVPKVHLVTRRLLVAEFLEGVTVLDYLRGIAGSDQVCQRRLQVSGFEPNAFARRLIDNFLGDAFRHGIFHADLHPANLMILPGSIVGYVDFGITGVLSPYSRYHLVMMTLAYTRADSDAMCSEFVKVSTMDAGSDVAAFRDGLKRFADVWYERQGSQSRLRKTFTLVMLDMLKLSRATGIWPERDVIKYIRSAIAIDGLITRLAPGFNVGGYLETVCDHYIRRESRSRLLTRERLVEWTDAGTHLLRDGPFRAAAALSRLSEEPRPPQAEAASDLGGRESVPRLRRRAINLATFALAVSLVLILLGDRGEIGWNLFTAGASLVAASLAMLVRTLHGLA